MKIVLDSKQMKAVDEYTIQELGIPSMVLMERAALSVSEWVEHYINENMLPLKDRGMLHILVLVGVGNNGGDGIAVARQLSHLGYDVDLLLMGDAEKGSREWKQQYNIAQNLGISFVDKIKKEYGILIDGMFGIGLTRDLEGRFAEIIMQCNAMSSYRVAIDIPSGVDATTGQVRGVAFRADATITFGYEKIGQWLFPGANYCGQLICADIGFPAMALNHNQEPLLVRYTLDDLSRLPKRVVHTNKGSYGKVMLVAGSKNMAGAAYFSATAAYRMGCGLVQVITDECNREIIQQMVPEAVLQTFTQMDMGAERIRNGLTSASVCVIGPGLGDTKQTELFIETVFTYGEIPVVIDADGLNVISHNDVLRQLMKEYGKPIVVTPHVKEMSRLCHNDVKDVAEDLISVAKEYSKEYNVIVVLKDARTIVAEPKGNAYINVSGNNGMATGGSGDVLSGIIGSLLAQRMDAFEAAKMGCYVHGLYGDKAAEDKGCRSMMAGDILEEIVR